MDTLVERLRAVSSCHVCDGMDELGLARTGLVGLTPLDDRVRVVGRAFTAAFAPVDEDLPLPGNYLRTMQPGQVVVVDTGGRTDLAVWGGRRAASAAAQGCAGAVIDGAYRDVEEHRELGFPMWGRAVVPMGMRARMVLQNVEIPVTLSGVLVRPGDIVVADASGVALVPSEKAAEIVPVAERMAAEDRRYIGTN